MNKTVIREYDFKREYSKYKNNDIEAEFEPITKDWLEKQVTWFTMKGNKQYADAYRHWPYPHELIQRMPKVKMFDRRYRYWLVRYDEQGVMKIRAGIGQPESTVGFLKLKIKLKDDEQDAGNL